MTSKSQSLEFASQPRLNRTTAREVTIEPLDYEHLRYVFAANKKSSLKFLDVKFTSDLEKETFNDLFTHYVRKNQSYVLVVKATTPKGIIPVGLVFLAKQKNSYMISDFVVFWWASKRNIVEGISSFFRILRDTTVIMFYASIETSRFPNYLKKIGLIRSVGRLHDVIKGPANLYQTRRVK